MIPHISIINMKWVPLKFNSSKFNFIIPFSSSPPHKWKLIEDPTRTPLDLVKEFNGQNLYRIGKCYPLKLLLWKYVYFTGWPIDTISLNCSIVCVNDDIPYTGISHDMISPHYYIYFGHEHLPGSTRVSKNYTLYDSLWSGLTSLLHTWFLI